MLQRGEGEEGGGVGHTANDTVEVGKECFVTYPFEVTLYRLYERHHQFGYVISCLVQWKIQKTFLLVFVSEGYEVVQSMKTVLIGRGRGIFA